MKLTELLKFVEKTALDNGFSRPYLCGGVPRDKLLGRLTKLEDLDVTTGDESIFGLARKISSHFPELKFEVFPDRHSSLFVEGIKLDFSSNFNSPNIDEKLKKLGNQASSLEREVFSRDFTCNSLIMSMDFQYIRDITGVGEKDIKSKIIRTCLPAKVTLTDQPRRIIRAIVLAAKLDFEVDDDIVKFVKSNPDIINTDSSYRSISSKILKALEYNKEKTIDLITKMELWDVLPATPGLSGLISERLVV